MTTTTQETTTGPAVPTTEWPDELSRTKNGRRAIRREIAEWLRLEGLPAAGAVWEAATYGERDLATLADLARDTGMVPVRLEGNYAPEILEAGDYLPDHGGRVCALVRDPETGGYWATVTRRDKSRDIDNREWHYGRTAEHPRGCRDPRRRPCARAEEACQP